jgi:hypothetical protein
LSPRRNVSIFLLLFLLVPMLPILKVYGAPATIAVDPPVSNVTIGDNFNINITVTNIVNFTCWELKLYFLNGVLNCTAAVEGPFLKTENGTYYGKTITNNFNVTHGQLIAYCTVNLITNITGSGTILTVTFKAVGGGNTPLHMADIKLGDEKIPPQPIPHTTVDGIVHVTGGTHDVVVTNVANSKFGCVPMPCVGQNLTVRVNVTVANQGNFTETFNVTAYANSTSIASQNVTLASGNSTVVAFIWNTTGFAKGNYTISGAADVVSGETNTADNNVTDGMVLVTLVGDVNGDRKVRVDDILAVATAFGSNWGEPKYSPNLDINDDRKIRVDDVLAAATHFGEGPW